MLALFCLEPQSNIIAHAVNSVVVIAEEKFLILIVDYNLVGMDKIVVAPRLK